MITKIRRIYRRIIGLPDPNPIFEKELKSLHQTIIREREVHKENIKRSNELEKNLFKILFEQQIVDKELKNLFQRLNYQRVVDDITNKIIIWKILLLIFSFSVTFGLYQWATKKDSFISDDPKIGILSDYERMIGAIDLEINWQKEGYQIYPKKYPKGHQFEGQIDSTFVELAVENIKPRATTDIKSLSAATETFWNIYFTRYLLIRVFITIVIIMLLNAGIKVYMRLRRDRMSLIYREEATTAIIYFIGKYMGTKDKDGNNHYPKEDREQIAKLMPLMVKELYYNPDAKVNYKEQQSIVDSLMQMMQSLIDKTRLSSRDNNHNNTGNPSS